MATGPPDCQDQIVTKRRVLATFCNFWHRSLCNHTALINLGNTARSARCARAGCYVFSVAASRGAVLGQGKRGDR